MMSLGLSIDFGAQKQTVSFAPGEAAADGLITLLTENSLVAGDNANAYGIELAAGGSLTLWTQDVPSLLTAVAEALNANPCPWKLNENRIAEMKVLSAGPAPPRTAGLEQEGVRGASPDILERLVLPKASDDVRGYNSQMKWSDYSLALVDVTSDTSGTSRGQSPLGSSPVGGSPTGRAYPSYFSAATISERSSAGIDVGTPEPTPEAARGAAQVSSPGAPSTSGAAAPATGAVTERVARALLALQFEEAVKGMQDKGFQLSDLWQHVGAAPSPSTRAALQGALLTAVKSDNAPLIRLLTATRAVDLEREASLSLLRIGRRRLFASPLLLACHLGHRHAVQALIQAGSDVNATATCMTYEGGKAGHYTVTPLSLALQGRRVHIAELLVIGGAYPNLRFGDSAVGLSSPLLEAASLAVGVTPLIRKLVNLGAEINVQGPHGLTPLCVAVRTGNPALVKYLLRKAANINLPRVLPEEALLAGRASEPETSVLPAVLEGSSLAVAIPRNDSRSSSQDDLSGGSPTPSSALPSPWTHLSDSTGPSTPKTPKSPKPLKRWFSLNRTSTPDADRASPAGGRSVPSSPKALPADAPRAARIPMAPGGDPLAYSKGVKLIMQWHGLSSSERKAKIADDNPCTKQRIFHVGSLTY